MFTIKSIATVFYTQDKTSLNIVPADALLMFEETPS